MGLAFNNMACELALREQCIPRDVPAGDVTALQQWDGHANLVRAFVLFCARYQQSAYFFGV